MCKFVLDKNNGYHIAINKKNREPIKKCKRKQH